MQLYKGNFKASKIRTVYPTLIDYSPLAFAVLLQALSKFRLFQNLVTKVLNKNIIDCIDGVRLVFKPCVRHLQYSRRHSWTVSGTVSQRKRQHSCLNAVGVSCKKTCKRNKPVF